MTIETLIVGGAPVSIDSFRAGLIREAKLLVAVDAGANLCVAAGRIPDTVVGDMDSISNDAYATVQSSGSRLLELPISKDMTDLEVALGLAGTEGWPTPTLTAVLGGRSDHELAVWGAVARSTTELVILEPTVMAVPLTARGRSTFRLDEPGRTFSLMSLFDSAVVSVVGGEFPLDHGTLESLSGRGVSNRVRDVALITVHSGTILLIAENVFAL